MLASNQIKTLTTKQKQPWGAIGKTVDESSSVGGFVSKGKWQFHARLAGRNMCNDKKCTGNDECWGEIWTQEILAADKKKSRCKQSAGILCASSIEGDAGEKCGPPQCVRSQHDNQEASAGT